MKAAAGAAEESLLLLASLLSLQADDAALIAVIEALGGKPRVQPSDQLGFTSIKKAGVEFRFEKKSWVDKDDGPLRGPWLLTEVGVYAAGYEGYKQYSGSLPNGVTFESSRKEVRKALGKPIESGGGNRFGTLVFPTWDRFRVARKYFVRFSYLPDSNCVCTVGITLPALADT